MKVERILYGMQTADGKIALLKTPGVNNLLSFKNIEYIKNLKPADSGNYLWFKMEQTIAYPVVIEVADKDPKHGGRTWVQNQTFLVNIHEFLTYSFNNNNPFKQFILPEQELFPSTFEALNV
jgi:hypothetical protein